MGDTVKRENFIVESDDYAAAEATTTSKDSLKGKVKILVVTDVTDKYMMLIGKDQS